MLLHIQNILRKVFSSAFFVVAITAFLFAKMHAFRDYESEKIIGSDVNFYYEYLPATFIYDDLTLHFADSVPLEVRDHIWYVHKEGDVRLIKTTMGVAYFLAPSFFIANSLAPQLGYKANGYSMPYRIAVLSAALLFSFLSLLVLRRTLKRFFKDWVVSLTLITLFVGTNLFVYTASEPGMSHLYGFFLFASFIELSILWYEKRSFWRSALLGFVVGLAVLVRPTNILFALFIILWDIRSVNDLILRAKVWLSSYQSILIILFAALIPWIPQLLYWKYITGHFLYFSYNENERFFFDHPQIIRGLFSYRKGWLLYTPVMSLSILGILMLYKYYRQLFLASIIYLPISIYVAFSWWCWWYGGSFGQRSMIESYALLAFPLAAFITSFDASIVKRIGIFLLLSLFIYVNQVQAQQYRVAIIHWDAMSKKSYWMQFMSKHRDPEAEKYLEPIDYEAALNGEYKLLAKH
jgi:hypothetical protein